MLGAGQGFRIREEVLKRGSDAVAQYGGVPGGKAEAFGKTGALPLADQDDAIPAIADRWVGEALDGRLVVGMAGPEE